jgi:anti-anti-sigma factor
MKMTLLHRADDVTHVLLEGRFDATGADEIKESFSQAIAARERPAIVDLSQVDFMASRGIGVLLANGNRLLKAGHKLVILNPQELVESVLRTTRVDVVMPIAYDLDEALRFAQGGQVPSRSTRPRREAAEEIPEATRSAPESTAPSIREGELKLSINNDLSELPDLNATLAQFLDAHGVPHRAAYAVNLAIDELVVNVINYAYVDDDVHRIELKLTVERDDVMLQIVDDGRPFDPRTGPSLDLHAEERRVGGLGLILVLDMVDALKYQRVNEENWVEVRIRLAADDQPGDQPAATSDSRETTHA